MDTRSIDIIAPDPSRTEHEFVIGPGENRTIVAVVPMSRTPELSLTVRMAGEGGHARIVCVLLGIGSDRTKLTTMQIHEAPATTSDLIVKSVLGGASVSDFSGVIRINSSADKANAYQRNENLLVSDHARAISNPTLEILANDVRCTHGATVGPVPEEEIWYLKSRGIPEAEAVRLYVDGFIRSAFEGMPDDILPVYETV